MIRDWLIANAETVTRVAVFIICLLGAAVAFVVLAGLVVAFRPDAGYVGLAIAMAMTFNLPGPARRAGRAGRHRTRVA